MKSHCFAALFSADLKVKSYAVASIRKNDIYIQYLPAPLFISKRYVTSLCLALFQPRLQLGKTRNRVRDPLSFNRREVGEIMPSPYSQRCRAPPPALVVPGNAEMLTLYSLGVHNNILLTDQTAFIRYVSLGVMDGVDWFFRCLLIATQCFHRCRLFVTTRQAT